MSRAEKRRKFNEAIINTLYPPPPPPPPKDEELEANDFDESLGFDQFVPGDPEEVTSSASGDDSDVEDGQENGSQKLTRAQRKRLRRKKLKRAEPSSERRKIIGPLLPSMETLRDDGGVNNGDRGIEPQSVRRNSSEEASGEPALQSEAPCSYPNKSRVKQRRRAKKLATASSLESRGETLGDGRSTSLTSSDGESRNEDRETKTNT